MKTITIHPVTRIEGHARITLHLDEQGRVADSHFHVTQVRGFEKFTEGRPFYEMPSVMARICGICPVSHLLASSKACDAVMAVRVPPAGARLRSILHFGQFVQSHALSFFHLSSPDLLLGMDSDPARRNIFGVIEKHPELAREGIALRKFGQQVIEWLAGERVHPAWVVPGGVNAPLTADVRDRILREIPSARAITMKTLALLKRVVDQFTEEIEHFGNHPSLYLGLVDPRGNLELYDGRLRIMDDMGKFMTDQVDPETYQDLIGEAVLPTSYLKAPFYKPLGYPRGIYRVGPLARINLCDQCGTPAADAELAEFRQRFGRPARGAFHYHYARLIEVIFCLEKMEELLDNPNVLDPHVRAEAGVNAEEGIGVAEAPRGTLIHHYRVDPHGTIRWANLIIATGHNNLAINQAVLQVARHFVDGNKLREGMLNRVEAVVRCYDPCLSCSTHAIGQMPLRIQLVGADGQVLDEQHR
ncbi:MAG TPA: Ni/Fe hydrogenase subunit alpha [Candidatus Sumerlaeota bacterium]|nr:Ni/Fe hydrogenase subunit alpha [Candidatus Sumerlaeota bacterium]